MAAVIVKSGFISAGKAGGYLRYIGTRERVEILPDARPPTRKQEQLIQKLGHDFPSVKRLPAYERYAEAPTKYAASRLITETLEDHWKKISSSEGYAKYIANRPRAERLGSHGLFGDEDHVDLDSAMQKLQSHQGNVWTQIISLHREDAARLGYDHAESWRDLLRSMRNEFAAAMNIEPDHLHWYAAFHDEGHHPHVHMMLWSSDPKEGFLNAQGIKSIKSMVTNEIFRQDMLHLYEDKSQARDELVAQARQELLQLTQVLGTKIGNGRSIEEKLIALARQLPDHGKLSYGYLPKAKKTIVDQIVDELCNFDSVNNCYKKWMELRYAVESYYKDVPFKEIPLSQQKEFRSVKSAVIKEAVAIRDGTLSLEDGGMDLEASVETIISRDDRCQTLWYAIHNTIFYPLEERLQRVSEMEHYARQENTYAQFCMGMIYRDGGPVIPDTAIAKEWFEKAAPALPAAQYALGALLLSDDLLVKDQKVGLQWMQMAASNGIAPAQYRMGKESLRQGDEEKAIEHFTRAADQGNQFADYMLGKIYLKRGQKEEAMEHFSRSAEKGNAFAQYFVDRREDLTTPSAMLSATRFFHHLTNIFRTSAQKLRVPRAHMDSKRLKKQMEKRAALGIRGAMQDEEYEGPTLSM